MTVHLAIINVFFMQGINKLDRTIKGMYKWFNKGRPTQKTRTVVRIGVISIAFGAFLVIHFVIFYALQHSRDPENVTTFLESVYFAVTTYGTIGFGDVTPQSMDYTQAMEVLRVLLFASTGLALVGLCFSLYREAADKNMKVITKKMSVLPQRISLVQMNFIDTLQRGRSSTSRASSVSNGSMPYRGTGSWSRVQISEVLEGRGDEEEGMPHSNSTSAPVHRKNHILDRILQKLDEDGSTSEPTSSSNANSAALLLSDPATDNFSKPLFSRTHSEPVERESSGQFKLFNRGAGRL